MVCSTLTVASGTCDFSTADEVTDDFCAWLNNNPNPTDTEINDKTEYYTENYYACTNTDVKNTLETYVTELTSLYFGSKTVDDLLSTYCAVVSVTEVVLPSSVWVGEETIIKATFENTGSRDATVDWEVVINGVQEATGSVAVQAGSSTTPELTTYTPPDDVNDEVCVNIS